MRRLILWYYATKRKIKAFELIHKCHTFSYYDGINIKKCVDCKKEYPIHNLNIKHKR